MQIEGEQPDGSVSTNLLAHTANKFTIDSNTTKNQRLIIDQLEENRMPKRVGSGKRRKED